MFSRCWTLARPAGCWGTHLQQNVAERTALEVLAAEPLVEQVEDREQTLLRGRAASPRLVLYPLLGPSLLPALEERDHEVVIGSEVVVEGRLRHAGLRDQLIDADVADPPAGEQVVRGLDDPLLGPLGGFIPHIRLGHAQSIAFDRPVCL